MNMLNIHYSQKTPSKVTKEIQLMINLFRDLLLGTETCSLETFLYIKKRISDPRNLVKIFVEVINW